MPDVGDQFHRQGGEEANILAGWGMRIIREVGCRFSTAPNACQTLAWVRVQGSWEPHQPPHSISESSEVWWASGHRVTGLTTHGQLNMSQPLEHGSNQRTKGRMDQVLQHGRELPPLQWSNKFQTARQVKNGKKSSSNKITKDHKAQRPCDSYHSRVQCVISTSRQTLHSPNYLCGRACS